MTSLRELVLGETKLQKVLQENREQEPVLRGQTYDEILVQLNEENEIYKSHAKVKNREKYITFAGLFLCASLLVGGLSAKQDDLATILGVTTIGTGMVVSVMVGLEYNSNRKKRSDIGKGEEL